ncbi:MAG: diguanylate cyclase [Gammaproteobacteria bacterium]|nr:diguanylate cyclase [Gammaproteobacteria bacterium]MDH5304158.1 diguanylate cyclase [Gammaproteobacteria bacterium]
MTSSDISRRLANATSRYSLIALMVLLFSVSGVVASEKKLEQQPIRFEHLSLKDGLSQSTVLDVLQDSRGMLWIATENGLNRYDGYKFTTFYRERGNPRALSSDFIFDIEEDSKGNLWIATNDGGLVSYDRDSSQFRSYRNDPAQESGIASNVVRRVLVDTQGSVWLATRGAGLQRFNPATQEFTTVGLGDGVDNAQDVYALFLDSHGVLWAGGDQGLTGVDVETGEATTLALEFDVRAIAEDVDGRIWAGTEGGGLSRLKTDGRGFDHFPSIEGDVSTIGSNVVQALFTDSAGRLWAGTTGGLGLVDHESGAVTRYKHDAADLTTLSANDITTIYEDRSGLLWFGTKTQGLSKWNPRTWAYGFEPAKSITPGEDRQPVITSFVEDAAGKLWIGTFGDGLNVLDRDTGDIVRYRNSASGPLKIGDDRVMSLMRDRMGRIWAGTMTSGITRLDPKAGESRIYRSDPEDKSSVSANGIMTIFEDSRGRVWVGTFGGGISLYEAQTDTFVRMTPDKDNPNALSSARVTSFAEDASGLLWVGTESGGLNLLNPESGIFHRFQHDPDDPATLSANTIYDISIDQSGAVWIGTHGGGLDRVVGDARKPDEIRFSNLSRKDGLANDVVYGVEIDNEGIVWASTNYGISKIDPRTGDIDNLHSSDGLQSEEFNFGAHYRGESGELFFGGMAGFNAFRPENTAASSAAPLIALTGFFNSNDPLKADLSSDDETVELGWKDDTVTFEFAALDFAAPEQNHYMYKLEGFDREWIDLGNRRSVTYTDLDDGNYLLRVKAANSEGVWNESGFALPVRVAAAPWDTWWAYLGYIALAVQVALALWLGHRRKIRREEEYSWRLENEVRQRTEELAGTNDKLREANKALQESSLSDPLTGLRNRRFVFEEVSRDVDVIRRRLEDRHSGVDETGTSDLVFLMIDMDNFKPINDTYGHAAGDEVLLQFRDLLLGVCRRSDFVVRWGGDEFVVIAKQAREGEPAALAERIRSIVANHNFALSDGQIVRTSCSIGFTAFPIFRNKVDGSGLDEVIHLADKMMYEAKKQRNAWVGMLSASKAVASHDFDEESLQPTSALFRMSHKRDIARHAYNDDDQQLALRQLG